MSENQSNDMYFDAVYVVESLPPGERRTGEELYDNVIGPASFQHAKLLTDLSQPNDRKEFFTTLGRYAQLAEEEDRWPLLHIEGHANRHGLELASSESVKWSEMKVALQVINTAARLNLLVTVAACSGGYLAGTITPVDRAPVWAVIGPAVPLGGNQVLEAFGAFYSDFLSNLDGNSAIAALREVERKQGKEYIFMPAETMFRSAYQRYIRDDCNQKALREREKQTLALAKRLGLPSYMDERAAREMIRTNLRNHQSFFERFRARFFMTDLFPENADRFEVHFEDVAARHS